MATVDPKDVPLVLRMQQRIQDLEKDKARLFMEVDRRDFGSDVLNGLGDHSELQMYEAFKVSVMISKKNKVLQSRDVI